MNVITIILIVAIFLLGVLLTLCYARTYMVEHQQEQAIFAKGSADMSGLDGDYKGIAHGYSGSWQGKTIFKSKQSGINRFLYDGKLENKYPFAISVRKALRDVGKDVLFLDYNQNGNPWWLKYVGDEMVQVGPQEYLGKVHVVIASDIVFTLGYFSLTK